MKQVMNKRHPYLALWTLAFLAVASPALAGGIVDLTTVALDMLGSFKGAVTIFGCVMFSAGIIASAAARELSTVSASLLSVGAVIAIVGQIDVLLAIIGVTGGMVP